MRVGFLQNKPRFLKVRENIEDCLERISAKKADLWVLPELFASGYRFRTIPEVWRVAEEVPDGYTCRRLREFSSRKGCAIVAGLPEKSGVNLYNSAVLIHKGRTYLYRKAHLFWDEKRFFKPGNTGFWVRNVGGVKVGVMICYDWFYPESCRTLSLKGAQIVAHPANLVLPWGPDGMRMRSLENRVFSVTADRSGVERRLRFIGRSQVVSPKGEILVRAGPNEVKAGVVKINPNLARDKKVTPRNNLFEDRRPELYL